MEPSTRSTLSTWLDRWIDDYAPLRCNSLKTIERYRQLAKYVTDGVTPELAEAGRTQLADLNHKILEPGLLSLRQAPAIRHAHLSDRTIRHIASLISVALDKASVLDLVPANPMAKVELPGFHPRDIRSLVLSEIQALREVCRKDWTFPIVELALATGCRRGELLALEWRDVDWSARILSISKSLEETNAGTRVKSTKSGKPRLCRLPHVAMEALRAHRETHPTGKLIFTGATGSYRRPVLVSQTIVRRLRRAGVHDASMHTLRHTHATNLLSRGVPLPAISGRLGHADPNVTARIYCHALPPDDQRAADVWDEIVAVRSGGRQALTAAARE
jgi:integrase